MDRFTATMVALCVVACLIVMVIAFGTSSAIIARLIGGDYRSVIYASDFESTPPRDSDPGNPSRAGNGSTGERNGTGSRPDENDSTDRSSNSPSGSGDTHSSDRSDGGLSLDDYARRTPDVPDRGNVIKISPFIGLSDEKKNQYWWEIADETRHAGEDGLTFSLKFDTASYLARKYGSTTAQLMEFFRDGASADWRKDPPDVP